MRILIATEYLPPYISGIANRCKNLINGYRAEGHEVTVYSVTGTDCDVVVPSIPNPLYEHQRVFILPPLSLILQLLDFTKPVPYDIAHLVAPLCLSFLLVIPLLRLRGVKMYVSYHVYLEYYENRYVGAHPFVRSLLELLFTIVYFIPLVWLADCVGIPSKTADGYVFRNARRIHYLKSGLDTSVFVPKRIGEDSDKSKPGLLSLSTTASNASLNVKVIETPTSENDLEIKDLRQFAGIPSDSSSDKKKDNPLLIYVGRLAVEKNVEFLVQAMSHPLLTNATLVIVGDGPCRPSLEALSKAVVGAESVYSPPTAKQSADDAKPNANVVAAAEALRKKPETRKRIIFTGMILNEHLVASYYGQCDLFVSASASETFGFTVAEGMACGTPAVMVRSGAFKTVYKMVDDWMFNENDVDDYANKVVTVFSKGTTGRRYARDIAVKGFSVNSAVKDLLKTYQWIVEGCP